MRPMPEPPTLMHRKMHQRKSARRADELIRRQQGEEDEGMMRGKYSLTKELNFFEKVKSRMKTGNYYEFLKCLSLFAQDVISKGELNVVLGDLLVRHPDLANQYQDFFSRIETQDYEIDSRLAQSGKLSKHDLAKFKGEKFLSKPVSEMDVSGWERCGTSYVKLPANYPKLRCSGRTPDQERLLNDNWVSVTSGSEDYSFKHMRKNQYEEHLFRCEDDRFDLDMCIQCNASALRAMRALEAQMTQAVEADMSFRIPENALTAIHTRAIQRIYGEYGTQIVTLMKQNPIIAIPIIIARLKEKDVEWRKQKQAMGKIWQKVYEANYHKSLDHRSFYFKQTDKKHLGAKAMMQEVKDFVEKRRQEEVSLHSLSNPLTMSLPGKPVLVFDYKDKAVHDDVFKVMKYSIEEMCQGDIVAKLVGFWVQFVEPFFGLPARSSEEVKVAGDLDIVPKAARAPRATQDNIGVDSDPAASGGLDAEHSGEEAADAEPRAAGGSSQEGRALPVVRPSNTPEIENEETEAEDAMMTDAGDSDEAEDPDLVTGGSADERLETKAEDSEREFINCKPVAPSDSVRLATASSEPAAIARHVMYGNDAFYIFFRLHHYLYDRLRRARQCSAEKVGQGKPGFPARRSEGEVEGGPLPPLDPAAQDLHSQFMTMLFELLEGNLESGQFEDNVRALLGTNSYVLFTLDKLVYKIVKHLQHMHQDDLALKLVDLHEYEAARSTPLIDPVYAVNVRVLLSDENIFRFESRPDGCLAVQLMEPDRSEVVPGVLNSSFYQYLQHVTDTPVPVLLPYGALEAEAIREGRARPPFLRRSVPPKALGPDMDTAGQAVVAGGRLLNGLECKLACSTSKVSYVLDTEDIYMHHDGPLRSECPESVPRKTKFGKWLDRRQGELAAEGPVGHYNHVGGIDMLADAVPENSG
eukprot:jgi/Botrbrau1/8103/Bobra.0230s0026.1